MTVMIVMSLTSAMIVMAVLTRHHTHRVMKGMSNGWAAIPNMLQTGMIYKPGFLAALDTVAATVHSLYQIGYA